MSGAVCADVTSANVVGYLNFTDVLKLNNLGAAPFLQVSDAKGMDIQNIKPIFKEGFDWASGDVQIKLLKTSGKVGDTYSYYTDEDADSADGGVAGWFNDMDERLCEDNGNAVVFQEGEGFILYSNVAKGNVAIQYAGQVVTEATAYEIGKLNTVAGNVTPVGFDIQAIEVGDTVDKDNNPVLSEDYQSGDIQIKCRANSGKMTDVYSYYSTEDAASADGGPAGWFNDMDERLCEDNGNAVFYKAGEGFILYSNINKAYIKLPAPIK